MSKGSLTRRREKKLTYEFVLLAVDFKHEAVVCVSKDFLVDDGKVKGLS